MFDEKIPFAGKYSHSFIPVYPEKGFFLFRKPVTGLKIQIIG